MPRLKKKWMTPAVPVVPAVPITSDPATTVIAPYLNIRNAVRYSGLTKWALYDHIHSGRLPAKKGLGQGFIVRTADLDKLWESAEAAHVDSPQTEGRAA